MDGQAEEQIHELCVRRLQVVYSDAGGVPKMSLWCSGGPTHEDFPGAFNRNQARTAWMESANGVPSCHHNVCQGGAQRSKLRLGYDRLVDLEFTNNHMDK